MKFSLITPTHREAFLLDCVESVLNQTYQDWEMIVVPNGGVSLPQLPKDPRIKVVDGQFLPPLIGAIKNFSFSQGIGDYLVEVDSDDLLVPECLEELATSIDDDPTDFLYSNCVQFEEGFKTPIPFRSDWGRRQRLYVRGMSMLNEEIAFKLSPSALYHIHHAPDHVRVFKRSKYHELGGHDTTLPILDDLDLMCRFYLNGTWTHLDMPLYLYRLGDNTWAKTIEKDEKGDIIRVRKGLDYPIQQRYMDKMMRFWAQQNNLQICENLDELLESDIRGVGYARVYEELHKVEDKLEIMEEIFRHMAPGGYFTSRTICGDSAGYIGDPTSKSPWNLRSFDYWTTKAKADSVDFRGRWRSMVGFEHIMNNDEALKFVDWTGYALKGGIEEIEGSGYRGI